VHAQVDGRELEEDLLSPILELQFCCKADVVADPKCGDGFGWKGYGRYAMVYNTFSHATS
jgi:hypothetical protein